MSTCSRQRTPSTPSQPASHDQRSLTGVVVLRLTHYLWCPTSEPSTTSGVTRVAFDRKTRCCFVHRGERERALKQTAHLLDGCAFVHRSSQSDPQLRAQDRALRTHPDGYVALRRGVRALACRAGAAALYTGERTGRGGGRAERRADDRASSWLSRCSPARSRSRRWIHRCSRSCASLAAPLLLMVLSLVLVKSDMTRADAPATTRRCPVRVDLGRR